MRIKGYREEYLVWLFVFDALAIALALLVAYLIRFEALTVQVSQDVNVLEYLLKHTFHLVAPMAETTKGYRLVDYLLIWPVATLFILLGLAQWNAYKLGAPILDLDVSRRIGIGVLVGMAFTIAYNFFTRTAEYSRVTAVIAIGVCIVFLLVERWLARRYYFYRLEKKQDNVLIVGYGTVARRLGEFLRRQEGLHSHLVGYLVEDGTQSEDGQEKGGSDCMITPGRGETLADIIRSRRVDQVIIADTGLSNDRIATIVMECENAMAHCRIAPNLMGSLITDARMEYLGGIPIFDVRSSPLQGVNVAIKRMFDMVISGVLLALLSPLLLAIAALIKITSPGPVFYKQKRMGLDGGKFNMYKFRSMVCDAEADTPQWTRENDDRRTRIGKFLRATNLDELPQLINVLRGDMSLVGPRPERPFFVKRFRQEIPHYMLRHKVKAGMTGWAQVNGLRGDTSIEERINYDLYYIENWSLWFDIKILVRTLFAIRNAY